MDALALLLNRQSHPRLEEPAPNRQALDDIMHAAVRAPDHACLSPWQFIVCEGEGRRKLGEIYKQAAILAAKPEKDIERASQLPLRAPMVIVAIAKYQTHPKVPRVEQIASVSCAIHSMQMAAVAHGYNGVWRTGSYAQDVYVKEALGLQEQDEIVGFLYLGTPASQAMPKPSKDPSKFFEFWR